MALSPSDSLQSHRVDVCLSPINLLSMAHHHFLTILILPKTPEMQVRERTMVQKYQKLVSTHQTICGRLRVESIWIRRIRSSVELYENLDLTWHNAIPNDL
jgi:hypothetical protein